MMQKKFIFAAVICVGLGCKPRVSDATLKHEEDQPIRSTDRWQWETVTKQEFLASIVPADGLDPSQVIFPTSGSSPAEKLAQRMDYWIKLFDDHLRAEQGDKMANVPRPNTVVAINEESNAYVPALPVCVRVPVVIEGAPASATANVDLVSLASDGLLDVVRSDPHCIKRDFDAVQLRDLIKWFNKNHPSCSVKERANAAGRVDYVVSASCTKNQELEGVARADGVVLWTTPNWIVIYTGLVSTFAREEDLLLVVAHELGHYYRSHMTTYEGQYDFFYDLGSRVPARRPEPNEAMRDRGRRATQASRLPQLYEAEVGALHPALFPVVRELIRAQCLDGASCPETCKPLNAMLRDERAAKWFGDFPDGPLGPTWGVRKYRALTDGFPACGKKLVLASGRSSAQGLGQGSVQASLARHRLDLLVPRVETLAAADRSNLAQVVKHLTSKLKDLTKKHGAQPSEVEKIVSRATDGKIGWYTAEQEADEFALELVSDVGLEANTAIESQFIFYGGQDIFERAETAEEDLADAKFAGIPMEVCARSYKRSPKWKRANGKPLFPPIGDFYDDHHTDCYRAYNLDLEADEHQFERVTRGQNFKASDKAAWTQYVETATRLHSAERAASLRSGVDGAHRAKNFLRSCRFLRRKARDAAD